MALPERCAAFAMPFRDTSSGRCTASRRCCSAILIASVAYCLDSSVARTDQYDSMPCERASIPVVAVIKEGNRFELRIYYCPVWKHRWMRERILPLVNIYDGKMGRLPPRPRGRGDRHNRPPP